MTMPVASGYSSITIYLDDELFQQLLTNHQLLTTIDISEAYFRSKTYVHVHNHTNGHIKAFVERLMTFNRGTEIDLRFVMNMTV